MSWPRASLLIALLVLFAPWSSADTITVNTASDSDSNDDKCSLREAVEYFNHRRPSVGHKGCKSPSRDESDVVLLPVKGGPYLISKGPIRIHTELAINAQADSTEEQARIRVSGPQRAFVIFNDAKYDPPICNSDDTCSPGTAPVLDALSDPDDPDIDNDAAGDFATHISVPKFTGTATTVSSSSAALPPPSTVTRTTTIRYDVLVTLYATPKGGEREAVGSSTLLYDGDAVESWSITSASRTAGEYDFDVQETRTPVSKTEVDVDSANGTTKTTTTSIVNGTPELMLPSDATKLVIYPLPSVAVVSFRQIDIQGCGLDADGVATTQDCASSADGDYTYTQSEKGLRYTYEVRDTTGLGGLIYSNEGVQLTKSTLRGGTALKGGALYLTEAGGTMIGDTELRQNKAGNGAAVFAEFNSLSVERSLVTANEVTGSGAVLEVANPDISTSFAPTSILNTTVSGNVGVGMSLHDDMKVNASTVVLNTGGGINFNFAEVSVYNSIVAGNHAPADTAVDDEDCMNFGTLSVMDNSLGIDTGGCPLEASGNNHMQTINNTGEEQLMATDEDGGVCNSEFGLLCPLAKNGATLRNHKPRVLNDYDSIDESPIVNKGSNLISAGTGTCPGMDQRSEPRLALACDIGAVELQQLKNTVDSGGAISYGEVYVQSLGDNLKDEELLNPNVTPCPVAPPALPSEYVPGTYRPDVLGCPWIQKLPSKGSMRFLAGGSYAYTPATDYHGFDRFEMRVITTISVLNADPKDQSRLISAQVVVEPVGGISSSSVGGAADGFGLALLALLGLGARGRWRKQV